MNKKNIIYTGVFRFPDKDAASQRVLGIARSLRQVGYNVIFCGWEQTSREQDNVNDDYLYDGFPYYSQGELDLNISNKLSRVFNFIFKGRKTIKWIKQHIKKEHTDYIIAYNANVYFLMSLYFLCRKKGIKFIVDCTEWYQGEHLPGGKYGLVNLDNNLRIKFVYPIVKNVILISSFLEKYYTEKNCKVLIVPPLVDLNDSKWNVPCDTNDYSEKIKLIYAGNPAKKDVLNTLFSAVKKFNNKKSKQIEIHLIGIDTERFRCIYNDNTDIPEYIKCYGRVQLQDVPLFYAKAHFSILFRENQRYANAGFPTKVVESLSCGIPVICNITSDLGKYLTDEFNSFIIENISEETILKCFEKIEQIDIEKYVAMRVNAKNTANNNFHYENYSDKMKKYTEQI
jgi:glycosyltransferase involved in cell wall biosynthesis